MCNLGGNCANSTLIVLYYVTATVMLLNAFIHCPLVVSTLKDVFGRNLGLYSTCYSYHGYEDPKIKKYGLITGENQVFGEND